MQTQTRRTFKLFKIKIWKLFLIWLEDFPPILLTCLIGHNNPINGFRPAVTHPSRRLCFLRAYDSWLHQSKTGLLRFGLPNEFADFRRSPHKIAVSPEHPPPYERHGRASTAVCYVCFDVWLGARTLALRRP